MTMLIIHLLLAAAWMVAQGRFTIGNLAAGLVLGYLVLLAVSPLLKSTRYLRTVRQLIVFLVYFAWLILEANVKVAWSVLAPRARLKPGIIAVPLSTDREGIMVLLASLVTLTPGTISLDLSVPDRMLYVHALDAADPEAVRRDIKDGLERKLLEMLP